MTKFDIGNQIVSTHEPNKIGVVYNIINKNTEPIYFVKYPDGSEYANYEEMFQLVKVKSEDVLRYGEYLTDVSFCILCGDIRIRTIKYDGHIYYHQMMNGEVVEFKELI